jgi:histone-lysine N-methyltransferase SETMAR
VKDDDRPGRPRTAVNDDNIEKVQHVIRKVPREWVPSGQTVNQHYCIEVLTKLRERVKRKRPELWQNGWILHQDNAPAHIALSVKQFLANKNITVMELPPYSPDLAPCDFYLFPKIKSVLKGTHFL